MEKYRIINGAEFPYCGNILYNDGRILINDMQNGTGCVYVYKLRQYKTPLLGEKAVDWLCCGSWKRVIPGFRETETYGREPRTVKTLEEIAAVVNADS